MKKYLIKTLLVITTCFIVIGSVYAQSGTREKMAAYSFLNSFLNGNNHVKYKLDTELLPFNNTFINLDSVLSNKNNLEQLLSGKVKVDKLLTDRDLAFMRKQITYLSHTQKLDCKRLTIKADKFLKIDKTPKKKRLDPKYQTWKVMSPLLSIDRSVAILYIEKGCGMDCAGGELYVFKKQNNGKWAMLAVQSIWVS